MERNEPRRLILNAPRDSFYIGLCLQALTGSPTQTRSFLPALCMLFIWVAVLFVPA